MTPRGYRPCGACRALVSEEKGCPHWKVLSMTPSAIRGRARRAAQKAEQELTPEQADRRERNQRYGQNARTRAAEAVAEFRRMMTRAVTG